MTSEKENCHASFIDSATVSLGVATSLAALQPNNPANSVRKSTTSMSQAPPSSDKLLYRPEIMAASGAHWLGSIRLSQPISGWVIAAVAFLISSAFIAFIFLGSITRKARVAGITVPISGSLTVAAPNAGVLIRNLVKEGQQVTAGQSLFELSTERAGIQGEITTIIAQQLSSRQQSLQVERRLRNQQYAEKVESIAQRLRNSSIESAQLDQEIKLLTSRHDLAQQSVDKFYTLQTSGYISAAQLQQKQEEQLDIAARLSNLRRNKVQLDAIKINLQSDLANLKSSLATDLSQNERSLASLQQEIAENQNRKSSLITSAQAGIVTTITYQPGQAVNSGQTLAALIPTDNKGKVNGLEAHLYIPSRASGFVAIGQQVLIRYAAYPYQKFGLQKGTVTDISKTPFAPSELPQSIASTILSNAQQAILGFNSNEALYRIKVTLNEQVVRAYGTDQPLKPGMTLEADLQQDERRIWEWIVEPLLAVASR